MLEMSIYLKKNTKFRHQVTIPNIMEYKTLKRFNQNKTPTFMFFMAVDSPPKSTLPAHNRWKLKWKLCMYLEVVWLPFISI